MLQPRFSGRISLVQIYYLRNPSLNRPSLWRFIISNFTVSCQLQANLKWTDVDGRSLSHTHTHGEDTTLRKSQCNNGVEDLIIM